MKGKFTAGAISSYLPLSVSKQFFVFSLPKYTFWNKNDGERLVLIKNIAENKRGIGISMLDNTFSGWCIKSSVTGLNLSSVKCNEEQDAKFYFTDEEANFKVPINGVDGPNDDNLITKGMVLSYFASFSNALPTLLSYKDPELVPSGNNTISFASSTVARSILTTLSSYNSLPETGTIDQFLRGDKVWSDILYTRAFKLGLITNNTVGTNVDGYFAITPNSRTENSTGRGSILSGMCTHINRYEFKDNMNTGLVMNYRFIQMYATICIYFSSAADINKYWGYVGSDGFVKSCSKQTKWSIRDKKPQGYLNRLMKLKVHSFGKVIPEDDKDSEVVKKIKKLERHKLHVDLIAEEVKEIFDNATDTPKYLEQLPKEEQDNTDPGDKLGINHGVLLSYVILAVQELEKLRQELVESVESLKKKVNSLEQIIQNSHR